MLSNILLCSQTHGVVFQNVDPIMILLLDSPYRVGSGQSLQSECTGTIGSYLGKQRVKHRTIDGRPERPLPIMVMILSRYDQLISRMGMIDTAPLSNNEYEVHSPSK